MTQVKERLPRIKDHYQHEGVLGVIGLQDRPGLTASRSLMWLGLQEWDPDKRPWHRKFTQRLAEENGWTREFAVRAVEEYRKFVYLSTVTDHQVTPSDQVDQVWHLHILHAADYKSFCDQVVGRPFLHGPSTGGKQEDDRYDLQYDQTKSSYAKVFSQKPPEDLWPPAAVRFSKAFIRVCVQDHLIVDKVYFPWASRIAELIVRIAVKIKKIKR